MTIFSISEEKIISIKERLSALSWIDIVLFVSIAMSAAAIGISLFFGWMVAYGDAQSHLNISKRVVDSITPGLAQLGGIWLPLPHLFMVPLVKIEILYRTGLAGAIVSGVGFVVSCIYIYKFTLFITKNIWASLVAFFVYATNPNILYLQTTAMTESVLICFFILSSYYFFRFVRTALGNQQSDATSLEKDREYLYLIFAAFFGFCATLSRYDGWFLVLIEAFIIVLIYFPFNKYKQAIKKRGLASIGTIFQKKFFLFGTKRFSKLRGMLVLFSVFAFLGIFMWFAWDGLILGDPLYFTTSEFSAKSQQEAWKVRGELPGYHNIFLSFGYYFFAALSNSGVIVFGLFLVGLFSYLLKNKKVSAFLLTLILFVPFIFNVLTLYMGQSVIFIPHITPADFEWKIFNVRYGILMLPAAALFIGLLFKSVKRGGRTLIIVLLFLQIGLYLVGYSKVISLEDGIQGLSSSKITDADVFMQKHYDGGLVLMDDFARSINIIESKIPMQNIIYIGNKPYWPESMKAPEKYATWIVIQENDEVWKNIYNRPDIQGRMYKHFNKVYTSPEVLIFKRIGT